MFYHEIMTVKRYSKGHDSLDLLVRRHLGGMVELKDTIAKVKPLEAYVSQSRWIVECPTCHDATFGEPTDPRFMCLNCGNFEVNNQWRPVAFPKFIDALEKLLLTHAEPDARDWRPGQSLADVKTWLKTFHHSWTAPRTWVTGEIVTAAFMNTHVRDNMLETAVAKVTTQGDLVYATGANALARLAKGTARQSLMMNAGATAPEWSSDWSTLVRKSADQIVVNNSTTYADVTELLVTLEANSNYIGELDLWHKAAVAADMKVQFTAPVGCVYHIVQIGQAAGSGTVIQQRTSTAITVEGDTNPTLFFFKIYVVNGANAGTLQLQAAQNTANVSDLVVMEGATIRAQKVS